MNRSVSVVLGAENVKPTEDKLVRFGERGQKALKRVESASRPASRGLLALNSAVREGRGEIERWADRSGAGGTVLRSFGPAGLAAAAGVGAVVAAIATLTRALPDVVKQVAAIKDFAAQAALGIEAYQELAVAGREYGVTNDALVDGFKELALRADEFVVTGAGSAEEAFKRLGFTQEDLAVRLTDTDALFQEIIKRMGELENDAARIRVADEVFGGTAGEQFVRFLEGGVEGIRRAREEARRTGDVLGEHLVREADEMNDKLNKLSATIGTKLKRGLIQLSPILLNTAEEFLAIVDFVERLIDSFQELEKRSTRGLETTLANLDVQVKELQKLRTDQQAAFDSGSLPNVAGASSDLDKKIAELVAEREEIATLLKERETPSVPETRPNPQRFTKVGSPDDDKNAEREANKIRQDGLRLTEKLRTAEEAYGAAIAEAHRLLQAGAINQETYARAIQEAEKRKLEASREWVDGVKRGLEEVRNGSLDLAAGMENAVTGAFSSMEDALVGFVTKGKLDFKSFANSVIADLARIAIRQGIIGPLSNMLLGGGSGSQSGGSFLFNARGNAFVDGRVSLFGKGDVITRPTAFPMRGGGIGVMSELDDEAIMPITRTRDGRLGVAAVGGGDRGAVTVSVPVTIDASGADVAAVRRLDQTVEDLKRELPQMIVSHVEDRTSRGGLG